MNILSQRDSRWKNKKIGKSNSTIGDYGCTITCLAMQAGINPDEFNDRMTAVDGFKDDLVLWQKINQAVPWLKFPDGGRYYSYDDKLVKEAINKYGSCLVEVDFDGATSTPSDRHWILFKGDKKANDPWTGTEITTSKYPILKGFTIIEVLKKPEGDTMTDEQKRVLDKLETYKKEAKHSSLEGALDTLLGNVVELRNSIETISNLRKDFENCQKEIENIIKENNTLRKLSTNLSETVANLTERLAKEQKLTSNQQKEITTANNKVSELNQTVENLTAESNDWQRRYNSKNDEFNSLKKEFNEYQKTHKIEKFNFKDFIENLIKSLLVKK